MSNQRKINWVSRKAHSSLLFLQTTDTTVVPASIPRLLQNSNLEISYTTLASGFSDLTVLGLVTRKLKTVKYDNGMATRTFKGVSSNLNADQLEELLDKVTKLYSSGHSVETIAAIATIAGMIRIGAITNKDGWFDLETYEKYLRRPSQATTYRRAPTDAVGFIEYNARLGNYRRNSNVNDIFNLVNEIDIFIETYKK